MKLRRIATAILMTLGMTNAMAQTPFLTADSLDANKINAMVLVHGDMWWNPTTGNAKCLFPNGSKKAFNFAGSLWMSAYDAAGGLHVAAQTYRQDGNDYWPGPLDASGALDYATSGNWAKIWKVRRSDLETHQATTFRDTINTPQPILTWPAKGNVYARGRAGAVLNITEDMAPFVDLNGDGIYQPLKGEYPDIKGSEQALWWCFSDNGPTHAESDGTPLKVQINAMSYAYKRNTLIDQVAYYDYTVVNKSANDYHDMRIALWDDADLGYYMDDMIGFDSTWRMGILYNGTNDDGAAAGHPENSYGANPPAMAVTYVVLPGDVGSHYQPVGSYMYYNNDPSIIGNPTNDTQYNYYMRSRIRNGAHIQHAGVDIDYMYPDDPTVPGGQHGCATGDNPGDKRFILSSNDFSLNAGGRTRVVMALIVDTAVGGCGVIQTNGFAPLRELADTAWGNFKNAVSVRPVMKAAGVVKIYPNPAGDVLHIDAGQGHKRISICNAMGQRMYETECEEPTCMADVSKWPPGMYVLECEQEGARTRITFVKH